MGQVSGCIRNANNAKLNGSGFINFFPLRFHNSARYWFSDSMVTELASLQLTQSFIRVAKWMP